MGMDYADNTLFDPFVSPWPEEIQSAAEWVESNMSLMRAFPEWERLIRPDRPKLIVADDKPFWTHSPCLWEPGLAPVHEDEKLRLNTLVWPRTASRWAHFHTIVDKPTLKKIRIGIGTPAPLVMEWWDENPIPPLGRVNRISTELYMLPARPLSGSNLSLITLVDKRYWWWWANVTLSVTENTTTWANLISSIGTALGETINTEVVDADYLKPSVYYRGFHNYIPPLLDNIAYSIGLRLVRELDGTVKLQTSRTAEAQLELNFKKGIKRGGGLYEYNANADLAAMVPANFTLACLKTNQDIVDEDDPVHLETVTLASLALAEFSTVTGASNTKTQYNGIVADYDGGASPTNAAEITALAKQAAEDYFLFERELADFKVNGILDFVPEAQSDRYEWIYRSDEITTRVLPGTLTCGMMGTAGSKETPKRPGKKYVTLNTNQNNYVLPKTGSSLVVNCTGNFNFTGFDSSGNADRVIAIENSPDSTNNITLTYQDANSSAANRITSPDLETEWILRPGESVLIQYLRGPTSAAINRWYIRRMRYKYAYDKGNANYTVTPKDSHKCLSFNPSSTDKTATLPNPNTLSRNWEVEIENRGSTSLLLSPAAGTISGLASLNLLPRQGVLVQTDGTNYYVYRGREPTGVTEKSTTPYTLSDADHGRIIVWTGAGTGTFNAPATLPTGTRFQVRNDGSAQASLLLYVRSGGTTDYIPRYWSYEVSMKDSGDAGSAPNYNFGMTIHGVRKITASETMARSDWNRMIEYEGAGATLTLFDLDTTTYPFDALFAFCVRNLGTGSLAITPTAPETIDNATTFRLDPCQGVWIFSDGTEWYTVPGRACPYTGAGTPTHSAPSGTQYWDTTNNLWYTNSSGGPGTSGTTWTLTSGYDELSRIVWTPNEITGTTTLAASIGANLRQWQYVSGTGPYTVTLMAAGSSQHEFVAFWFKCALTDIVTLDGNANEEIRGPRGCGGVVNRTRKYVHDEVVVIWSPDGLHWQIKHETMLEVGFSAQNSAAQTAIVTATATKLTFDTENWDINANFAASRHTPLAPGIYKYGGIAGLSGLADGAYIKLMLYKNGALYKTLAQVNNGAAADVVVSGACEVSMNGSTDYVELFIEHSHGANRDTIGTTATSEFYGSRIRRDES